MTLTLRQKQSLFASRVADLIQAADGLGFEVTLGEAYRSPEEAARLAKAGKGIARSLHTLKLAIYLNLFDAGRYLSTSEAHAELGKIWEGYSTEGAVCAWGGRWGDGNHYSIAHRGFK